MNVNKSIKRKWIHIKEKKKQEAHDILQKLKQTQTT